MNNLGTTLAKLIALTGGALLGALLARWYDEVISARTQKRSERDKTYYERGLAPINEQKGREATQ